MAIQAATRNPRGVRFHAAMARQAGATRQEIVSAVVMNLHLSTGEYKLPLGLRGSWTDAQTFVLEYDGIGSNDHLMLRMRFEGNRVVIEGQETAHEVGVRFEGRLQNP